MTIKDEPPASEPTPKTTEIETKEDQPASSVHSPSANKIERETIQEENPVSASETTADPVKKKHAISLPIPAASRPTTAATTKQVLLDDCIGHCFGCCCYCCCICLTGEAP